MKLPQLTLNLKLALLLTLITFFKISAMANAQAINLTLKNAPLETAFIEIKKQTGYGFWYDKEVLKGAGKVTITIKSSNLREVLDLCFKNQNLVYQVFDRTVVVKRKEDKQPASIENNSKSFVVTGKVVDEKGTPMPGVSVHLKGTAIAVSTINDGSFKIEVPDENAVLIFTYLGYSTYEQVVGGVRNLNIVLKEELNKLQSVEINAGYYSVSQRLLTGSISSVKAEEIEKQPVTNPLSALEGRVTGAQITQNGGTPGANISIIIRGQNGIETSTNPLYIVDGISYGATSLTNALSVNSIVYGTAGSSPLNAIPPSDISSIEILKDADATAIYGSRGANGVVLISTKRGKSGTTKITLDHHSGNSLLSRTVPMLNTEDYLTMRRIAIDLDGTTIKSTDYDLNGTWDMNKYTNWQNELMNPPAPFHNSSLSISSGTSTSTFLLSGTRNSQKSGMDETQGYTRLGAHLAASQSTIDQKLHASFSATYSAERTDWFNQDLYLRAMNLQPNAPDARNPDASLNWAGSTWINPLRALENSYRSKNATLLASSDISYHPIKDFEVKLALGYSTQELSDQSATPVSFYDPAEGKTPANSLADYNNSILRSWSVEPQLSYQRESKIGKFSMFTGMSFQNQQRSGLILRGVGFASDALIGNIRAATTISVRENTEMTYKYAGLYIRAGYALKDRYLLNLTARRDASSRFGPGKQFANFGSFAAAWIFSAEKFIKERLTFLSFGKLRASYGSTGSDQIGDYEYLNTYQSSLGYNSGSGLSPVRLYNPNFGWEITNKFETALEVGLLSDRIRFIVSHYRNRSSSQLINYPLALSTGFSSVRANLAATIDNTGWETEISAQILKPSANKFSWNTSVNLTIPKNTLVEFPGLETSSYASKYAIGRPLSIAKQYHLLGVDPTSGLYTFQDFSGDGLITALDRQQIIEKVQKFYGGIDNSFVYKGLELSFLLQFVKQKATNLHSHYNFMPGRSFNQPMVYQGSYWTKPGDIATMQRLSAGNLTAVNSAQTTYISSDATVSDASFIRLKNVSLSYHPEKLLSGNIRFYLQAQNLVTITNYLGIDPESTSPSLPPLRTIVAGIQLNISVNPKN
ncbi:MAG: SusC/RagA family TonB-linked outer membrane protein [Bacteroidota bacterium]